MSLPFRTRFLLFLICALAVALPASAQQKPSEDDTLKLETQVVTVPVMVTDKKKNFITDLKSSDFTIYEDGKPQQIAFFSTELQELVSRPLAVMFLLDASGSTAQTIKQQRVATQAFLQQLSDQQLVAIARFSDQPELMTDFTTDKQKIAGTFAEHEVIGGETAIFDALDFAVDRLSSLPGKDALRRKVVILITDGLDSASHKKYNDVCKKAQDAEVSFYVIHIPIYWPGPSGHLEPRPTTPGFNSVAELTGGELFTAGDVQTALSVSQYVDLSPIFQKIISELRSQYYISYYPPNPKDGHYHRISLTVQRKDARPRLLRSGYLAK
ncbi:MAG TPA: VWA domain-containing protein [Blastocatellia bacterium]|nr:VWA domain-containing protein [Blastocatellia bacterium]